MSPRPMSLAGGSPPCSASGPCSTAPRFDPYRRENRAAAWTPARPSPTRPAVPIPTVRCSRRWSSRSIDRSIESVVFPIDIPGLRSDPGELVIDIYGPSELSGEVDDASFCSVLGTAVVTCGKIACVFGAAELPVAWPSAAAGLAGPTGLLVC
jgi:hypothetical protein